MKRQLREANAELSETRIALGAERCYAGLLREEVEAGEAAARRAARKGVVRRTLSKVASRSFGLAQLVSALRPLALAPPSAPSPSPRRSCPASPASTARAASPTRAAAHPSRQVSRVYVQAATNVQMAMVIKPDTWGEWIVMLQAIFAIVTCFIVYTLAGLIREVILALGNMHTPCTFCASSSTR